MSVRPSQNILARAKGLSARTLAEFKKQNSKPDDIDLVLVGIDSTLNAIIEHLDELHDEREKNKKRIITPDNNLIT